MLRSVTAVFDTHVKENHRITIFKEDSNSAGLISNNTLENNFNSEHSKGVITTAEIFLKHDPNIRDCLAARWSRVINYVCHVLSILHHTLPVDKGEYPAGESPEEVIIKSSIQPTAYILKWSTALQR